MVFGGAVLQPRSAEPPYPGTIIYVLFRIRLADAARESNEVFPPAVGLFREIKPGQYVRPAGVHRAEPAADATESP